MANVIWNGGDGDWTSTNWSSNAQPANNDTAILNTQGTVTVPSNGQITHALNLDIESPDSTLLINGSLEIGSQRFGDSTSSIINNGGTILIEGGALTAGMFVTNATGNVTIGDNGSYLWSGQGSTQTVDFVKGANNASFVFTQPFDGNIADFEAGNMVIYSGTVLSSSVNGNTVTLTTDKGEMTLHFTGEYDASNLSVVGNVIMTTATCFVAGTLIETPRGPVRVEDLRPGDLVTTPTGTQPIVWLGHRTVECTELPSPERFWPYRIHANAFGENKPSRDLWLSPDHAVGVTCLDEILIPIKHLVNGATVEQVPVERVVYWHVELESHDLLIAENLPAESFLDTRGRLGAPQVDRLDRAEFKTKNGRRRLEVVSSPEDEAAQSAEIVPQHKTWVGDAARPLITEGPVVDAVRTRLLSRASAMGWTLTHDTDLAASSGGLSLPFSSASDGGVLLVFPAETGDIRLTSRSFVPRHSNIGTHDERRLGVAIRGLIVSDRFGHNERRIALTDSGLVSGFHLIQEWEGDRWRWTDGDAVLSSTLWAGYRGMVMLRLELTHERGTMRAWLPPSSDPSTEERHTA